MAKPKWLMKPVDMYETNWGFRVGGQGIIYSYEKREKHLDPKINYVVLGWNRSLQKRVLFFDGKFMSMSQIRRNVEVNNDFSSPFKKSIFRIAFEGNQLNDVKRFLDIIREI